MSQAEAVNRDRATKGDAFLQLHCVDDDWELLTDVRVYHDRTIKD